MPADARYALRVLARSPLFTLTSVLSLAVGIGAAATIFELSDALLLQPSPGVRDAGRVVEIERTTNGSGYGPMSYPVFQYLREHTETLESMAAMTREPSPLSMSDGATGERVFGGMVSANFFDLLGVRPALGRFFRADEDAISDARPVAVLSHRFWRERFEADPRVLDRPIRLNGTVFGVIGVAEAGFEGTTFFGTDLWVPTAMAGTVRGVPGADLLGDASATWHRAAGRLRPGVTRASAQAELNTLLEGLKADDPAVPASHGVRVERGGRLPPPARQPFGAFLGLLFVLTGELLTITCANVAGLLLVRSTVRQREMATRLAARPRAPRLISTFTAARRGCRSSRCWATTYAAPARSSWAREAPPIRRPGCGYCRSSS